MHLIKKVLREVSLWPAAAALILIAPLLMGAMVYAFGFIVRDSFIMYLGFLIMQKMIALYWFVIRSVIGLRT